MKSNSNFFHIFLVNFFLSIFLFFCVEFFLRVHSPHSLYQRTYPGQYQNGPFDVRHSWHCYDKDLGWVFNKYNVIQSDRYQHVFYKANQQGFRDEKNFNSAILESDKKRVMVMGDSFIFGLFINQEDTIPELLQKRMSAKYLFYNFGMPGWGVDQMYWAYKEYRDKIKPDVCILFFIDSDILRAFEAFRKTERMNKPSFEIQEGRLVFRKEQEADFWEKLSGRSYLLESFYNIYRELYSKKLVYLIFKEMIQQSKERGEKLIVVRIPGKEDLECHDWVCGERLKRFSFKVFFDKTDVNYIELFDFMKDLPPKQYNSFYIPNNVHLTRKGGEFIANIISSALTKGNSSAKGYKSIFRYK